MFVTFFAPPNHYSKGAENTIGMMEAGMIPNVVDYYDVDTDPQGRFVTLEQKQKSCGFRFGGLNL